MIVIGMYLMNRYEILEKIGSGGMADVYKAKDHTLNRFVAIKILKQDYSTDETFIKKFRVEAQSAGGLSHPNIVSVYDVGEENGIHFIVMELVQGITLKDYIDMKGKLGIREALNISVQIASGLSAAHDNRIIHRDIKPQNIIMSRDGKVKVTDFGIAKMADSSTVTTTAAGTVHYISPEQARGGYSDEKSDIYSLGITMYEMVTGRVPFEGETNVAVALLHIQGEMIPPRELEPSIPKSFEKIILKCTQKKPDRRYASARELIADLRKVLTHPDGEYVVIPGAVPAGRTIVMQDDEVSSLKEASLRKSMSMQPPIEHTVVVTDDDDDDEYIDEKALEEMNEADEKKSPAKKKQIEPKEDESEQEPDFDDDDDGDLNPVIGKVMMGLGIVGAIILAIIIFYIASNAAGLFGGKGLLSNRESQSKETIAITEETQQESNQPKETNQSKETEATKQKVTVPNLDNYTEDEAKAALDQLGLGYKIETGPSEEYEEGHVYEQSPAAGEEVEIHDQVMLYISTGASKFQLDDVSGMNYNRARDQLQDAGLIVTIESENHDDVEADRVIRTEPEAGSEVSKGTTVKIIVSLGKKIEMISVPDVRGKSLNDAIAELQAAGLEYNSYSSDYSDNYNEGDVMDQSIEPNQSVEKGTSINLTVSEGPRNRTYTATVYIPNPFGTEIYDDDGEAHVYDEGYVRVVLEQDGSTRTIYDATTTSEGLDSSVTVESTSSSTGTIYCYIDGHLYREQSVSFK